MKAFKKAYALAVVCLLVTVLGLSVPSDGAGPALAPFLIILALVAGGFGVAGQFGSAKTRQWVENNF